MRDVQTAIVHMAGNRQRRRQMSAWHKRHGVDRVKWFDAVDGRRLAPEPPWRIDGLPPVRHWPHWIDPYARRAMTLGEVGCSLSHVLVWQYIAGRDYPVLVLEDDATPVEPLIDDLPLLFEDLSHIDFDLCVLGQRNTPGPKWLLGRHVHLVDYHPVWTLAYLLTPRGAHRLLATPWARKLVPADELLPAAFGLNRDPEVNRVYSTQGTGLVVASHQRFFTPAQLWTEGKKDTGETERSPPVREPEPRLSAFTVATEHRPELERLLASGRRYGIEIEPLGLGQPWRGGDMAAGTGGGQKINLLRPALAALPPDRPVLFVDGYDTIVTRHAEDLLAAWKRLGGGAVFAAEAYCWPDTDRAEHYPEVDTPYRFLNSGVFLGQAGELLRILEGRVADSDDDQRYYTGQFLSGRHAMRLDYGCELFQCLNGALGDVQADPGRGMLFNRRTESWPAVIHANGPAKPWLDAEGRAVGGRWRRYYGSME